MPSLCCSHVRVGDLKVENCNFPTSLQITVGINRTDADANYTKSSKDMKYHPHETYE
jgi:hypothetical protein